MPFQVDTRSCPSQALTSTYPLHWSLLHPATVAGAGAGTLSLTSHQNCFTTNNGHEATPSAENYDANMANIIDTINSALAILEEDVDDDDTIDWLGTAAPMLQ